MPDKGLKADAIGYVSNLVISVASVAPGYSLAATLGFVVAVAGAAGAGGVSSSFIPMLLIARAYRYINKADPDCGTTFSWVTRRSARSLGWLGGWAIIVADIIVMANLASIAGIYSFLLFGWQSAADSTLAVTLVGRHVDHRDDLDLLHRHRAATRATQNWLLTAEVITLALFAVGALVQGLLRRRRRLGRPVACRGSTRSRPRSSALLDGVLLAVFIYWGWDSGVAVNEESEDRRNGPGKAAVVSTISSLGIYVVVSIAAQAYGGAQPLIDNSDDVLSFLGDAGLPAARQAADHRRAHVRGGVDADDDPAHGAHVAVDGPAGALPKITRAGPPRYLTPDISTIGMGVISIVFTSL